jgi:hypothetical protein
LVDPSTSRSIGIAVNHALKPSSQAFPAPEAVWLLADFNIRDRPSLAISMSAITEENSAME